MAYISFQPKDYFNTHLYSGNNTTNNQQVGLTPDLVWVKSRNTGSPTQHYWVDSVRGDKKYISSNATTAEQTDSNTFDLVSGGFNLAGSNGWTNLTGRTYASWNWKANGAGSSNTDGSITSTVSANTTSGFSIVQFTGTGANATVGHGLGSAPKMVIVKETSGSDAWIVGHSSIGFTKNLLLNGTNAEYADSTIWNNTAPTSSVFSVGSSNSSNESGATYIAYCFAEKQGFSKFGSYTGNGNADGTFVYTGFKPAFVIVKQSSASGESWKMYDNKRPGYNLVNNWLEPDDSQAEGTGSNQIDMLSNGWKARATNTAMNASGSTYIYMAFAEAPLVSSNGVPAVAR